MIFALLLLNGCYRQSIPTMQVIQGRTMGTTYSVKFSADDSKASPVLLEVSERVESELKRVNMQMSTYIADSEISQFNRSSSTDWFTVSSETAEVVGLAVKISELTDGAFDVTVGPLVELWGFGSLKRPTIVPTNDQIQQLLPQVGYRKLHVRTIPPALRKDTPELAVNLSAIAKGHGVDRIAAVLRSAQIENFFIEIGGEVATDGHRLDGRPWQVGIERPDPEQRTLYGTVELAGQAIATSGDYRNFYELDGRRYSHTIDPGTGRPVEHALTSATAIADSCALADAIATSMMVLGSEAGLRLAEELNWKVCLIVREEDGLSEVASTEFAQEFPIKRVVH